MKLLGQLIVLAILIFVGIRIIRALVRSIETARITKRFKNLAFGSVGYVDEDYRRGYDDLSTEISKDGSPPVLLFYRAILGARLSHVGTPAQMNMYYSQAQEDRDAWIGISSSHGGPGTPIVDARRINEILRASPGHLRSAATGVQDAL